MSATCRQGDSLIVPKEKAKAVTDALNAILAF
jgi:hypothetical protein